MISIGLMRNDSSTAFFSHWLTFQLPSRLPLGDARLAAVEQVERRFDRLAHLAARRRRNGVALLEGLFDGLFEASRDRFLDIDGLRYTAC